MVRDCLSSLPTILHQPPSPLPLPPHFSPSLLHTPKCPMYMKVCFCIYYSKIEPFQPVFHSFFQSTNQLQPINHPRINSAPTSNYPIQRTIDPTKRMRLRPCIVKRTDGACSGEKRLGLRARSNVGECPPFLRLSASPSQPRRTVAT